MQAAYAADDWDQLAELAHWLKGAGGTIGFDCFTEPARQVEQLAKRRQSDRIEAGIDELSKMASRIVMST